MEKKDHTLKLFWSAPSVFMRNHGNQYREAIHPNTYTKEREIKKIIHESVLFVSFFPMSDEITFRIGQIERVSN